MHNALNLYTMATLPGLKVLDGKMLKLVEFDESFDGRRPFYQVALGRTKLGCDSFTASIGCCFRAVHDYRIFFQTSSNEN